jgi:hypothetical protein
MAWRECTGVVVVCSCCAGTPTCCLWTFADAMSKEGVGPPFWIVGALIGVGIGFASGVLGCVLARNRVTREILVDDPAEMVGAKVTDEAQAVRALRYLIGVPLALLGTAIGFFWLGEIVHKAMR